MEELIVELKEKAGLTEDQAMKALGVITEYIKGKLPPMMSGFVDNFLGSSEEQHDDILGH